MCVPYGLLWCRIIYSATGSIKEFHGHHLWKYSEHWKGTEDVEEIWKVICPIQISKTLPDNGNKILRMVEKAGGREGGAEQKAFP